MMNRRNKVAHQYACTHEMDSRLVCKLLKNGELLYDDTTKTITIDMKVIEQSDADNSAVQALKSEIKLPSALKERIFTTKMKNNNDRYGVGFSIHI